jgi:geranylgeranyl pyrophosphate synthase
MIALPQLLDICRERTNTVFNTYFNNSKMPSDELQSAMAYGVLNGGKRIRPLLVYATGLALNASLENLDVPAAAIEMIHSYSLIHDDLPAMDNADLRRGKPSCHKQYGEAMAILAGDSLQTTAFTILAEYPSQLTAAQRIQMVRILSYASGQQGMAAGQALDILGAAATLEDLQQLHYLKTGALLSAAVHLGAAAAHVEKHTPLENYAYCLGLAFQIQDDLLDVESDTATLGKPQGLDAINGKKTYPQLLGTEKSRQKVAELTASAMASIETLGANGALLRELAQNLLLRQQ